VVDRAVDTMRELGAGAIVAGLGPCIGPCCYEFSPSLAAGLSQKALPSQAASWSQKTDGPILARTRGGRPSLDLPAAVRASLRVTGVPVVVSVDRCTACTPGYFSHRARRDEARQALFVWREG
jgi:copper oxidase (laccase) domain-containing protein